MARCVSLPLSRIDEPSFQKQPGQMFEISLALILLTAGFYFAEFGNFTAILLQTAGILLLLHGIPANVNKIIVRKFPAFGALVKGKEPYNTTAALPKRIVVTGFYAVFLVVLGLGAVVCVYLLVDAIK